MKKTRVTLEDFLATLDVERCKALYASASATRGELPCARSPWPRRCETPPEEHETCGMCFGWRDCTDPACDHPACGHGVHSRFRDAFMEEFPEFDCHDVLIERDDPVPLIEHGRLALLVDEETPNQKMGAKVYEWLQKRSGGWLCLYDVPGDALTHVAAEVWLHHQGVPVEAAYTRYQLPAWVAMSAAEGEEIQGGHTVVEFRLAEAATLEDAPMLCQGALF